MQREIIHPENKDHWLSLRAKDLTSTEISSLFGCSPYLTAFELWHRKKNKDLVRIEETERMRWGNRLEQAIANGIAEDHTFELRDMKEYIRIPELRIGSSFDFEIRKTDYQEGRQCEPGILEIKNVDALQFKDGWEVDGDCAEAPLHIEMQVQHQLLVSGLGFAKIGAFIGGNRVVLIHREPDLAVHSGIKQRAQEFWDSIEKGIEPRPDFQRDAAFIAKLYKYAEPGKVMEIEPGHSLNDLAIVYKELGEVIKVTTEKRDGIKAAMLMALGDAEKVKSDMFTISAGLVGPAEVSYTRDGYRSFRINWKKEKK